MSKGFLVLMLLSGVTGSYVIDKTAPHSHTPSVVQATVPDGCAQAKRDKT
jgi:hypothetical protein